MLHTDLYEWEKGGYKLIPLNTSSGMGVVAIPRVIKERVWVYIPWLVLGLQGLSELGVLQ